MEARVIPLDANYSHFLQQHLTGLYSLWKLDRDTKVYYTGPYAEALTAFSPHPIEPTESAPESTLPIKVSYISCVQRGMVSRVLDHFAPPDGNPCITIVERRNNRRWPDAPALLNALRARFGGTECNIVVFEDLSFVEQLTLMRRTAMLVGVHGAAITNCIFMKPGASVLEVFPGAFYFDFFSGFCERAKVHHAEIQAHPSPEFDLSLLPKPYLDYIGGRPYTRELYQEIVEAHGPDEMRLLKGWRGFNRDVDYAWIAPEDVVEAAHLLWQRMDGSGDGSPFSPEKGNRGGGGFAAYRMPLGS